MHDIICPHCGESFVATDVAFDLSSYILPLLCSDPKDAEDVKAVGFRFLVDEDTIVKYAQPGNKVQLRTDQPGGPDIADAWYPFVITNRLIALHMESQIVTDGGASLAEIVKEIGAVRTTRGASYTMNHTRTVEKLYRRFFNVSRYAMAKDSSGYIDMTDDHVQTVIKILTHVFANPGESVTLSVRLYAPQHEMEKLRYSVPDVLFVLKDDGFSSHRHYKCCRFCGTPFPQEYGYYKMMPVVLLGSHYSGKTSYLLSLLYTVQEMAPFAGDGEDRRGLRVTTLSGDEDLVAFSKNVERFRQGQDPDKTDFTNVPILNLLVNDIIYTFVDWPGEKFIDDEAKHDDDFANETRRVIRKARHFLCFLEPTQVDHTRAESEERVRFTADSIARRFNDHFQMTDIHRLRSITYILNKLDLYEGGAQGEANPNAAQILKLSREKSETSVYMSGRWNQEEYSLISGAAENFLRIQNATLHNKLTGMHRYNIPTIVQSFVPVAPYGDRTGDSGNRVLHRTRLAGLPLLRIMERDKDLSHMESMKKAKPE